MKWYEFVAVVPLFVIMGLLGFAGAFAFVKEFGWQGILVIAIFFFWFACMVASLKE